MRRKKNLLSNLARRLLRQMPPSTIVYVARMGAWIEGTRFDNGEGGVEPGYMDLLQPTLPWAGKREDALAARVTATIEELAELEALPPIVITYLNRLSDWLFALARAENAVAQLGDVEWIPKG